MNGHLTARFRRIQESKKFHSLFAFACLSGMHIAALSAVGILTFPLII